MTQNQTVRPRVSIGLPVFNGENYLGRAIKSILAQTFSDFEMIICDNASTDETASICQNYALKDHRIRYVRNPQNIGASANFNKTFELSVGEYFKWAAHDDLILPEYLERCVSALDSDSDAVLAQPIVGIIDSQGNQVGIDSGYRDFERAGAARLLQRFAVFANENRSCFESFALVRRDALAKTALVAPYPWSDVTLIAELALLGRFVLIPEVLFLNRDHPARFARTALFDREASWRWWCSPEGPPRRRLELCAHWYVETDFYRIIRKHVTDPYERRQAYLQLFRHMVTPYVASRLILEPVVALHPRIRAAAQAMKSWLNGDASVPFMEPDSRSGVQK